MGKNQRGKWRDQVRDMQKLRLSGAAGTVAVNYAENAVTFSPNGVLGDLEDMVGTNFELEHGEYLSDGAYTNIHIHWWQDDVQAYEISYRYRVQDNNAAKTTAWTTGTVTIGNNGSADAFTHPDDGTVLNQISSIVQIDISTASLSDTIQFQMTRSDAVSGDWDAYVLDRHWKDVASGSDNEFSNDEV